MRSAISPVILASCSWARPRPRIRSKNSCRSAISSSICCLSDLGGGGASGGG